MFLGLFELAIFFFHFGLHRPELFLISISHLDQLLLFIMNFGLPLHLLIHLYSVIFTPLALLIAQGGYLLRRVLQLTLEVHIDALQLLQPLLLRLDHVLILHIRFFKA